MNRRAVLTGTIGTLVWLAGCLGSSPFDTEDSPPSNPTRRPSTQHSPETPAAQPARNEACAGATSLSFYGLKSGAADTMWSPRTVRVAFHLGAGADVLLVVFEGNTVLGMTHVSVSADVSSDGQPIPLNTTLSGTHTLQVVMYPASADNGQTTIQEATPCQHNGTVIQTVPTTINFSSFSENSAELTTKKTDQH
jgi:hypothetical protein